MDDERNDAPEEETPPPADSAPPNSERTAGKAWYLLPFLVVLAFGALLYGGIYAFNNGLFVYTADDAYVHLSVSEQIAGGSYGINEGEISSASSSIVWPFLLAPFAGQAWHVYVPLVLNTVFTLASVVVLLALFSRGGFMRAPRGRYYAAAFVAVAAVALNVIAIAFTGMEHSLQIFLALLALHGMVVFNDTGKTPWWLVLAMVLGPLVRFELLAVTFAAALVLLFRRRFAAALLGFGLSMLFLAGFAFFLYVNDLALLPNSVLVHSDAVRTAIEVKNATGGFLEKLGGYASVLGANFLHAVNTAEGRIALLLAVLLVVQWLLQPRHALAAFRLFAIIVAVLGLAFGQFGGEISRYETWLILFLAVAFLYSNMGYATAFARRAPSAYGLALAAALLLVLGAQYVAHTVLVPWASHAVYTHQFQVHRFLTRYYDGTAAVQEVGLASYRNDDPVLDLAGVASEEARTARQSGDADWMDRVVKEAGIPLAILSDQTAADESWIPLATLAREDADEADQPIVFYAIDPEARGEIVAALDAFKADVPQGVVLTMSNQSPPRKDPDKPKPEPAPRPQPETEPAPRKAPDAPEPDETPAPTPESTPAAPQQEPAQPVPDAPAPDEMPDEPDVETPKTNQPAERPAPAPSDAEDDDSEEETAAEDTSAFESDAPPAPPSDPEPGFEQEPL